MNKPIDQSLKPITIFLCITLALSAISILIIYSGTLGGGGGQYVMGLCGVLNFGIDYNENIKRDISDLGWKWGKLNIKFGYLIPIFYTIAYLLYGFSDGEGFTQGIC
jgi:hypothetical protein